MTLSSVVLKLQGVVRQWSNDGKMEKKKKMMTTIDLAIIEGEKMQNVGV